MNTKSIIQNLYKKFKDYDLISKICVYTFLENNEIKYCHSAILSNFLKDVNKKLIENIAINILNVKDFTMTLLIEFFETIIPAEEKKEKGIAYTPDIIKRYILEAVIEGKNIPYICDPACGCGSFLITAAEILHNKYKIAYKEIIERYLFGADINTKAINQAKVLLSIITILNGEEEPAHFNLICGNMLDKTTVRGLLKMHNGGYDCIVGNPPYVRSKNIDVETKKLLSSWETAKTGNMDLYIPFFEIGLYLLKPEGCLGYITPNTYIQAVNGRALRNLFIHCNYGLKIIDFRDAQIFGNVTNYTCISLIEKSSRHETFGYCRIKELADFSDIHFSNYAIKKLKYDEPWRFFSAEIDDIIFRIEHMGIPISHWKIRNGLATLKNDVFFFIPTDEDDKYFYRVYNRKEYKIEKDICINIAKPNVLKTEKDLAANNEKAIFPYSLNNGKLSVINELYIAKKFPEVYKFLLSNKQVLLNRDKGRGEYEAWYAYGRTQGMNNFGKKLLVPYISGEPVAILSTDEKLLFYCGYALFSDDLTELKLLKTFLESDVFWYYLKHTSKPYSKGYMSFAKNYIKKFSVPNLNPEEKKYILQEQNKKTLNEWIWHKYLSSDGSAQYKNDIKPIFFVAEQ